VGEVSEPVRDRPRCVDQRIGVTIRGYQDRGAARVTAVQSSTFDHDPPFRHSAAGRQHLDRVLRSVREKAPQLSHTYVFET